MAQLFHGHLLGQQQRRSTGSEHDGFRQHACPMLPASQPTRAEVASVLRRRFTEHGELPSRYACRQGHRGGLGSLPCGRQQSRAVLRTELFGVEDHFGKVQEQARQPARDWWYIRFKRQRMKIGVQ